MATADATDTARILWSRYCDFQAVYGLAMRELIGTATSSAASVVRVNGPVPPTPSQRRKASFRPARQPVPSETAAAGAGQ